MLSPERPGGTPLGIAASHRGFSLLELLVVVGIIALLISIILPALGGARDQARLSTCLNLQRQLVIGVAVYAGEHNGHIPRGPDNEPSFIAKSFFQPQAATEDQVASSVILSGPGSNGVYFNSHGLLLDGYLSDERSMFCPGDNTTDPQEELKKVRTGSPPAFSSYVYRNLDQAPRGRLSGMGYNDQGIQATALVFDSNSVNRDFPTTYRTNHKNDPANVAYTDGHARSFPNSENTLSLTKPDYDLGFGGIEAAYNRMLMFADRSP